MLGGILPAGGVATQHFLKAQLVAELSAAGFHSQCVTKIEYDMTTEFAAPLPAWMEDENVARPWDWLCVAKKGTKRLYD